MSPQLNVTVAASLVPGSASVIAQARTIVRQRMTEYRRPDDGV